MVVFTEIAIILALILANGFFAGAEIAIIAARRSRLTQQAESGSRGARLALELSANPNRFLPTVQLGITLVGTFAAAFGGAHLEEYLAEWLAKQPYPWLAKNNHAVALTIVVMGITYFSVLLGELVPKRVALLRASELAKVVAFPMDILARIGRPAVWFMGLCTNAILTLLGAHKSSEPEVSLEDIEHVIHTGTQSGVLDPAEQRMAMGALTLGDRTARDIMRPRMDLDALDVNTPADEVLGAVAMSGMTRLPIYDGHVDNVIGFVSIKDVLRRHYLGLPIELRKILHPVLFIPETLPLDRLLVQFQERGSHLAIVLDEFGGTEGLVTLQDLLESVVGRVHDEHARDHAHRIVRRDETSWLVDGTVSLDDFQEMLDLESPTDEESRPYSTVAGLVLDELGRIPRVGDRFVWQGIDIEVVDMDGQRVDRLLVSRPADEKGAA